MSNRQTLPRLAKSQTALAPIVRFEATEVGRVAVVQCPYCEQEHSHVLPEEISVGADLVRDSKCKRSRGNGSAGLCMYRLDAEAYVNRCLQPFVPDPINSSVRDGRHA